LKRKRKFLLKGKKVTVFGLGRSGVGAIKLLLKSGADVFVTEERAEIPSPLIIWLESEGISFELGMHSRRAIEGKDLIVVSPGVNPRIPILEQARREHIPIIGELELAYNFANGEFIAITGTSGKSTTVSLIGSILSKHGENVAVCGNIGIPVSEVVLNMNKKATYVVEVSSFQLETILNFKPYIAVFLNFSDDHLDRYDSSSEYLNAKLNIFKNQTINDYAVLNKNDKVLSSKDLRIKAKIYYFSSIEPLKNGTYIAENDAIINLDGVKIKIPLDGFKLKGLHNKENLLSALCASYLFLKDRFSESITREVIYDFKGLPHRFEFVNNYLGIDFINDSKSTKPESTIMALKCLNKPTILILGGSEKGTDFIPLANAISNSPFVKMVIITGKTQKRIKSALESVNFRKYKLVSSLKNAIHEAILKAHKGEVVLLSPACASFDEFSDFEERGEYFKKCVDDFFKGNFFNN